jgi:O-antigen ligase
MLAVVDVALSKRGSLNFSSVLPLLALVVFALLQSLFLFSGPGPMSPVTAVSADPFGTRSFAVELLALTLVILLLARYVSSQSRLQKLLFVIIGIGVASALFGMIRQHWQQSPGFLLPALPLGNRSFGQFINRNHFALLLEMSLGLTLGLIVGQAGSRRRLLILLPISGLLWVALIYSNSRGGIIASFCQLLFIAVLVDPLRLLTKGRAGKTSRGFQNFAGGIVVRAFLIVILIGLFIYGVGWIGGEPVVTNFELAATDFSQQEMQNNTNTSRKEIWFATLQMIKEHPVVGVGFGGYWIGITRYHHASGEITPQQAHNDYLELMASGGLFGCALAVWFLLVFVRSARRRLGSSQSLYRAACLGALTGIFGGAIHSFVDFGLHITINALVFCALIALVLLKDIDPENPINGVSAIGAGTSMEVSTQV